MKLRISDIIIGEVAMREMDQRFGQTCYTKIGKLAKASRIDFDEAEVAELKAEADYWNGDGCEAGSGYVKAWRALYRQIVKAGA
jgi:hypothetical protein